jgi:hypothetical protein
MNTSSTKTTGDPRIAAKIISMKSYLGELQSAGKRAGNPVYDEKMAQLAALEARLYA